MNDAGNRDASTNGSETQAETMPEILYKYRHWNDSKESAFHRRRLTNNEIYFSKPSEFNDPFDCQITLRFDGVKAGQMRKTMIKWALEDFPGLSRKERDKIVRGRILELRQPNARRDEKEKQREVVDEGYGVFSLSATVRSLVMWAHYADSHKGICVGLSSKALRKLSDDLFRERGIPGELVAVDYVDRYPVLNVFSPDFRRGMWGDVAIRTKSSHWRHEKEYRLFIGAEAHTARAYVLPDDVIRTVILGYKMPPRFKEEIRGIVEAREAGIRIIDAELSDDSFELDFGLPHLTGHGAS